ncbi:MAG: hypothetical protein CVU05_01755 [Bacteroidetes bacterium HGW-Bacteroidetes-21]|jgi:hypothetical protein|nr:MAG: hypothetical protein CVU05_01755 [Bacteroidetes bacterium HGW-Bacteroidetes-21]
MIFSFAISIIAGGIFILSGITKLFPIEYFETVIIDRSGMNNEFAEWIARILIGFEWTMGLLLLFRWRMKKITIPLVMVTLIGFCTLLIIQLLSKEQESNCACFGSVFMMTPVQALLKNVVLIVLLITYYFLSEAATMKSTVWLIPILILSFSLPFIFRPGEIIYPTSIFWEKPEKINLSLLYTDTQNTPPEIDITKGKIVIAFFSLKCKHCQLAAFKIAALYKQNPDLPLYMILNGDSSLLDDFFRQTKSEKIPHRLFFGTDKFLSISGPSLPAIYLINNSQIEGKFTYRNISQEKIEDWLSSH